MPMTAEGVRELKIFGNHWRRVILAACGHSRTQISGNIVRVYSKFAASFQLDQWRRGRTVATVIHPSSVGRWFDTVPFDVSTGDK